MKDGIAGANMRQKGVAQALPFGGAFHQAGNVNYIEERGDFTGKEQTEAQFAAASLKRDDPNWFEYQEGNLQFRSGRGVNSSDKDQRVEIPTWLACIFRAVY